MSPGATENPCMAKELCPPDVVALGKEEAVRRETEGSERKRRVR